MVREISSEVQIAASPERVWSILTEFSAYPAWNPLLRQVRGELRPGHRLEVRLQRNDRSAMTFRPRVLVVEPARELRWLGRLGLPGLFDGEHVFSIRSDDQGSVRFRQSETFRGLLVPFLWRGLQRDTAPRFERMNEALRRRVEEGPQGSLEMSAAGAREREKRPRD